MKGFSIMVALVAASLAIIWLSRKDYPAAEPALRPSSIAPYPQPDGSGTRGAEETEKISRTGYPDEWRPSKITVGAWSNYAKGASKAALAIRVAGGALNHNYEVTPAVVRLLTLSPAEEVEINKLITSMIADAETRTASQAEPIPGKENGFRIKADPVHAEETVSALGEKLAALLGSARGKNLLDSLDLFRIHGAFGAVDCEITFEDKVYGEPGGEVASLQGNYVMSCPETGVAVTSGGGFFDKITAMFGKKTFAIAQEN